MARWYGKVGYSVTEETIPGVWEEKITERNYYGEDTDISRRWEKSSYQNDNFRITNSFSIMADAYAYQHFNNIRYIEYGGVKWKVTTARVERPRIHLTIGTEYNGGDADEKN